MHLDEKLNSFDDLRYDVYHKTLQEFDLEKFPTTSSAIKQHILRAYLQCHLWFHAHFIEDILIDPLQYWHSLNEEDDLVPLIINDILIPVDFPPCNYLKCARPQGCRCRIKQIACSRYCKCEGKQSCKNTSSCWWIIMQDQFTSDISCWHFQKMCIFIWENKKNSFFSDFRYEFFSPDGKKNKTLFIVWIESLYLKDLQTVIQLNLGVWEFVRIRWFFEL